MKEVLAHSLFSDFDISLFISGKHFRLYEKFGAHLISVDEVAGAYFSVWAPNAQSVHVIADFNDWNRSSHLLNRRLDSSGIWEGFIPGVGKGDIYKFLVKGFGGEEVEKGILTQKGGSIHLKQDLLSGIMISNGRIKVG